MKKIIILLSVILLASCANTKYVTTGAPREYGMTQIIYETRPDLVKYFESGVLEVTGVREIDQENGVRSYDINYRFVRYNIYNREERVRCLAEYYPGLYQMYINGTIEIVTMYRYVDADGVIQHMVSYRKRGGYYYPYTPPRAHYHYYQPYRPPKRVTPPPPIRHNPQKGYSPRPQQPKHNGRTIPHKGRSDRRK